MNKGELVNAVSKKIDERNSSDDKPKIANIAKKDIDSLISVIVDTVIETVASGEKVTLVGFGTFEPRNRKEREGRNPKTGDKMTIPATIVPAFSPGKNFKEQVKPK